MAAVPSSTPTAQATAIPKAPSFHRYDSPIPDFKGAELRGQNIQGSLLSFASDEKRWIFFNGLKTVKNAQGTEANKLLMPVALSGYDGQKARTTAMGMKEVMFNPQLDIIVEIDGTLNVKVDPNSEEFSGLIYDGGNVLAEFYKADKNTGQLTLGIATADGVHYYGGSYSGFICSMLNTLGYIRESQNHPDLLGFELDINSEQRLIPLSTFRNYDQANHVRGILKFDTDP